MDPNKTFDRSPEKQLVDIWGFFCIWINNAVWPVPFLFLPPSANLSIQLVYPLLACTDCMQHAELFFLACGIQCDYVRGVILHIMHNSFFLHAESNVGGVVGVTCRIYFLSYHMFIQMQQGMIFLLLIYFNFLYILFFPVLVFYFWSSCGQYILGMYLSFFFHLSFRFLFLLSFIIFFVFLL